MIKSPDQLKAKVRNISKGNNDVAKSYIRIFFMERFLERVVHSTYKDQFILKGGMLAASLLGIDMRSTMDIDTTVKALPLTVEDITRIVNEICSIDIGDNVSFEVSSIGSIMDEFEYPGIRIQLVGYLGKMKQPFKIDISTDDEITPNAIEYDYKLMFEERSIMLRSYNVETLLAEKIQTVLARNVANTRMRDFFDIYSICQQVDYSDNTLRLAFEATCRKRNTLFDAEQIHSLIVKIRDSKDLSEEWECFVKKNYYADTTSWTDVVAYVCNFIESM
ncbi:MAG: nucleotidyl transferase AbiEii/AbiGii toxin family protein [Lachnospiraceae bacterium]|nr:nucleotidyl transferase AbiEii/AbiGii toxin family protein [Lachnospiraceae bacterium]